MKKPAHTFFTEERLMNLMQDYNYSDLHKDTYGYRPRSLWLVGTLCENVLEAQHAYAAAHDELVAEYAANAEYEERSKALRFAQLEKWMDDNRHKYSSLRYAFEAKMEIEDRDGFCKDLDGNIDPQAACWKLAIGYDKAPILEGWLAS